MLFSTEANLQHLQARNVTALAQKRFTVENKRQFAGLFLPKAFSKKSILFILKTLGKCQ